MISIIITSIIFEKKGLFIGKTLKVTFRYLNILDEENCYLYQLVLCTFGKLREIECVNR